jgi:hypothetical protein
VSVSAEMLSAPFPWFGGKSRVADLVWSRFGADVPNYVEPFFGFDNEFDGRTRAGQELEVEMKACIWKSCVRMADRPDCEWHQIGGNCSHPSGPKTNICEHGAMRRTCDRCAEVAAAREAGAREFAEWLDEQSGDDLQEWGNNWTVSYGCDVLSRWIAATAKKEGK